MGVQLDQLSLAPRSLGKKECCHLQVAKAPSPPPYWLQLHSQSQYKPERYKEVINIQETKGRSFALQCPFEIEVELINTNRINEWLLYNSTTLITNNSRYRFWFCYTNYEVPWKCYRTKMSCHQWGYNSNIDIIIKFKQWKDTDGTNIAINCWCSPSLVQPFLAAVTALRFLL